MTFISESKHFDDFENSHIEEYKFEKRALIIVLPSSAEWPKNPERFSDGFEEIVRDNNSISLMITFKSFVFQDDVFCEIRTNIPNFSKRMYRRRKIALKASRVYDEAKVISVLYDFPSCLKTNLSK